MDLQMVLGENEGVGTAIAAPFQISADGGRTDMETPASDRTTPTSVYRYFDESGILIYVGITSQRVTRNRQHNADKVWWQWVASQKIDHFLDTASAHAREVELIKRYRPPFNKQHNPDHSPMSAAYIAARSGDLFWASKLAGAKSKTRLINVSVHTANWKRGEIDLCADAQAMMAAGRITFSDKRPVVTSAGTMIGNVYAIEHAGGLAIVKARIKQGWVFSVATVDTKIVGSIVLIRKVLADDAR